MEEPPGGENFGYRVKGRGRESLNYRDWIRSDFLTSGGWSTCTPHGSGAARGRPKTIKAEWLTPASIAAVEQRLGFTRSDFHAVVRKGRLNKEQRERREMIAARLHDCVRAGAAVSPLAYVLDCTPQTLWRLVRKWTR